MNLTIGQDVFVVMYNIYIVKGKVEKIDGRKVVVYFKYVVDKNGEEIARTYGDVVRLSDYVYFSATDAYDAYGDKIQHTLMSEKAKITNVESLLKYALEHQLCAEENTNYVAVEAFKQRAKELLGVDLQSDVIDLS